MSTVLAVRGHYAAHRLDRHELELPDVRDGIDAVLEDQAPVTYLPVDALTEHARTRHADLVAVVVARRGEESFSAPLGFALLERRAARPWRPADIRLAGEGSLDRQRFHLVEPDAAATLALGVATFVRRHHAWRLRLDQVSQDDPTLALLARCLPRLRADAGDPIPLTRWPHERSSGRWASKKARSKHRTACRRLDESGHTWTVRRLRHAGEIRAALPSTLDVRSAREHQLARRDAFADGVQLPAAACARPRALGPEAGGRAPRGRAPAARARRAREAAAGASSVRPPAKPQPEPAPERLARVDEHVRGRRPAHADAGDGGRARATAYGAAAAAAAADRGARADELRGADGRAADAGARRRRGAKAAAAIGRGDASAQVWQSAGRRARPPRWPGPARRPR